MFMSFKRTCSTDRQRYVCSSDTTLLLVYDPLNVKQKYLVSIFDIDWLLSQGNSACNSPAEVHFDLSGFCVNGILDTRTVSDVEQFGDEKALLAYTMDEKQTATITVYLQQCKHSALTQHCSSTYRNQLFKATGNKGKLSEIPTNYPRSASYARVLAVVVCLSVSHAGFVSKWLNVGSRKQRHYT